MNFAQVLDGDEIALPLLASSFSDTEQTLPVKTSGDLLVILEKNPPKSFKMLRTTLGHLSNYLNLPGDQIPFDLIEDKKRGFRPFLESRRYPENSIRTYVNHQRSLLKAAKLHGWNPDGNPNEAWKPLLKLAGKEKSDRPSARDDDIVGHSCIHSYKDNDNYTTCSMK